MNNPFFGNMPQQKGVAPQAAPSGTSSLNSNIDPIKRAKFTGYLEGMSANTVPPQPPQPPMMPQQPPMMMNMGGMVDVFDPIHMNEGGFVISTDDSGKIRTRPVFDEDKGRMVSQIMSRDMVDEMAKAAMAKANQPEPTIEDAVAKFIGYADKPESAIIDDSLKGVPDYTTTTIEPEESMISLPTQKPKIQLPVSKPEFSDIEVPVSKPSVASMLRDIDDLGTEERMIRDIDDLGTEDRLKPIDPFSYFTQTGPDAGLQGLYSKRTKPFVKPKLNVLRSLIGEEDGGIEEYDDPEELMDIASYIKDIDDLGTEKRAKPTIPPEEMEAIARMVTEGEKTSGPDVDVFDVIPLIDRFGEMDLNTDEVPKLRKLTGLEKLLKFIFPRSRFNQQFKAPSGQGIDSFNTGGIVQGFSNGGFTSNLRTKEGSDSFIESQYDKDADIIDNINADIAFGGSGKEEDDVFSTPYADEKFAKAEANPLNQYASPFVNFVAGLQTNPNTGQKYDMSNTSDRYDFYNLTQKTNEASNRAAEERKRDQDSAQRKLAEEQRLRDMIAGMMPPTAGTPAPPMVTAPDAPTATPATPDYSSVVVPSDRVPGFDVGNISPYPQFRMPTEFQPVFPESLSNSYFRDLFKNIGVSKMQEGGAVNQLDSAIDNFLSSYRQ
jgi:hypothetical protein